MLTIIISEQKILFKWQNWLSYALKFSWLQFHRLPGWRLTANFECNIKFGVSGTDIGILSIIFLLFLIFILSIDVARVSDLNLYKALRTIGLILYRRNWSVLLFNIKRHLQQRKKTFAFIYLSNFSSHFFEGNNPTLFQDS